eukprot:m.44948 g.44948  ORF g.44948 m.44948 type:complete len:136 (+) comp8584_c0_seq2:61-468(+)
MAADDGLITEEQIREAFRGNERVSVPQLVKFFRVQLKHPVHKRHNREQFQSIIDKIAVVDDVNSTTSEKFLLLKDDVVEEINVPLARIVQVHSAPRSEATGSSHHVSRGLGSETCRANGAKREASPQFHLVSRNR